MKDFSKFLFTVLLIFLSVVLFVSMFYGIEDPSLFTYERFSYVLASIENSFQNYSKTVFQLVTRTNENFYQATSLQRESVLLMNDFIENILNFHQAGITHDGTAVSSLNPIDASLYYIGNILGLIENVFTFILPAFFISLCYFILGLFDVVLGFYELFHTVFAFLGDLMVIVEYLHP